MKTGAVICAAGQGKRMGLGMNKQFIDIQGKPLLIHTLRRWEECTHIDDLVVVVAPGEKQEVQHLLDTYSIHKVKKLVTGGDERQESVYRGLVALGEDDPPEAVLIHDGARPFITAVEIEKVMKKVKRHQALVLAVPVKDTVKRVTVNGLVEETLDRSTLWAVQTPQAFHYSLILKAHQKAQEDNYLGTDDASLVERLGISVHIVQGSYDNIKLTTTEDLIMAEYLLKEWEGND